VSFAPRRKGKKARERKKGKLTSLSTTTLILIKIIYVKVIWEGEGGVKRDQSLFSIPAAIKKEGSKKKGRGKRLASSNLRASLNPGGGVGKGEGGGGIPSLSAKQLLSNPHNLRAPLLEGKEGESS